MSVLKTIIDFVKSHTTLVVSIIAALLLVGCVISCSHNNSLEKKIGTLKQNEKALMEEISGNQSQVREMEMSIETLQMYSDSISQKLLNAQKELKIKDKNVKNLQYMLTTFEKQDTLILTQYDTVFKDPDFKLDTLIGDTNWMNLRLKLNYPNLITTDINVKSEKEVIVSSKRETIDPPKKFFLFRWFQKKHTVTTIDVKEENPYISSQQNRFIKVSD